MLAAGSRDKVPLACIHAYGNLASAPAGSSAQPAGVTGSRVSDRWRLGHVGVSLLPIVWLGSRQVLDDQVGRSRQSA